MRGPVLALIAGASLVWLAALQAATPPSFSPREFVEQNCAGCHNDRLRTGGLTLSGVDPSDVAPNAELWEKVLHKLRTGQMPPANRPRPDPAALTAMMSTLASALDAAAAAHPSPGRVGVHRLNRAEYANAIRDLLRLEVDAKALLLPDEAEDGFDNVAASLALSPAHLERYLTAAREISRLAVGDRTLADAPAAAMFRNPKLLEQDVRVGDEMPFGSRGGIAVHHYFPLDAEYVFKVRLRRQIYDYIIGMGQPQPLDFRIDGRRITRVVVGGEAKGTPGPRTWNGEIVGDTEWELYMHAADQGLEARERVSAGTHVVTVSFVDSLWEREGIQQPPQVDFGRGSDERYDDHAGVDSLSIHGPYRAYGPGQTPSRRAIFVCTPRNAAGEAPCARRIVSTLARRAYRRPVTSDETKTLLDFYRAGRQQGGFDAGIRSAIERMLVSFNFLFRVEHPSTRSARSGQAPLTRSARSGRAIAAGAALAGVYRLDDVDLASELSFFLWSSIPDDELLDLAVRKRLNDPAVLRQQIRRMLRDARSKALVENFGSQWLGMRKALSFQPDPNIFPEFDENLRRAFLKETSLFLESQLRDDRSIVDLLTANYSFLNERLARHYGLTGLYGERFRKVTFEDEARGGLLGQGGLLMVTSYPDRTAPVMRGFWMLDNLFGMPPPPPPPGVPDLEPRGSGEKVASIRDQMEEHRRNPACTVCHVRMDPLGFAMENFDAIGRWRTIAYGNPVDSSAVFADGTRLEGVAGIRRFLLKHRENYAHTFVEKMLTYALGRRVDYRDQPAIRRIVRQAAADDYRWSAIILAIVHSTPFGMRNTAS